LNKYFVVKEIHKLQTNTLCDKHEAYFVLSPTMGRILLAVD